MGKAKAFTPEQELEVCEMYERVERGRIVAEAYGVSTETIYRILRRYGVQRTHRHPESKPKPKRVGSNHKGIDVDAICERFKSGAAVADIARELGCSPSSVYYHLEKAGLYTVGQRKAENDALVPQILAMHKQGLSDYEIAKQLGCGRDLVNKRLLKAGIRRGKGNSLLRELVCPWCGKRFETKIKTKEFCSQTCSNAAHAQQRIDKRRANTQGKIERIPLREIYERDHGRCYICGGRTDWNDYRIVNGFKVCGPRYPSRDHVIALHNGGTHTRDNIKLACRECNSLKSDKGQMCLAV